MKKLAWLAAIAALVASGSYIFVYLYRWEWHRALLVGVLFIATEIGVLGAILIRRIGSLHRPAEDESSTPDAALVALLREQRPQRDHFAWLGDQDGTHVFLPILLGSGVIISGIAWVVEKIAARTTQPATERSLAAELSSFTFPNEGLVPDETDSFLGVSRDGSDGHLRLLAGPLPRTRTPT